MKVTAHLTFKRKEGNLNRFHHAAWNIAIDDKMRFWARCLKEWAKNEDVQEIRCTVTVERESRKKSTPQLRYLNGVVYPAFYDEWAELNGARYPDEYVKRILKLHEQVLFVDQVNNPLTGQIEFTPKSCAGADVGEVWEFTNRLLALAAQIGVYIETPAEWCKQKEIDYEDFKRMK